MAQTENSAHVAQDWYLVANRNNLTIKIVKYITLGESETGLLVLDSRVESERWLTLEVDPAGCLNVVYQDPRCRLTCPDRWVADSAGAVLPRCTMLEMPNNKVYVSQQLQRGSVEQTVLVTCHNPTELEVANHFQLPPISEALRYEEQADEEQADEEQPDEELTDVALEADEQLTAETHKEELQDVVADQTAESLQKVVMAPQVLDDMLRAMEEADQASAASEVASSNDPDSDTTDADASEPLLVVAEPSAEADIPLLQDVADVYAFESADTSDANSPHAFELVHEQTPSDADDAEINAAAGPAVESVYARPGRGRDWRPMAIALALVLVSAVVFFELYDDEQPDASDSPFSDAQNTDAVVAMPKAPQTTVDAVGEGGAVVEPGQTQSAEAVQPSLPATPAQASLDTSLAEQTDMPGPTQVAAADLPVAEPLASEAEVALPSSGDLATSLDITSRLQQADVLIRDGYVNWGEPNAVQVLSEVFAVVPDHPEAMTLLDQAGAELIAQADSAKADGFDDAAQQVVQQVLVFHPNYGPALQRARTWSEATVD